MLLASAAAALLSFGLLPFIFDIQPNHPEYELILSMIMHASIWGLTGAVSGLAFGVGFGDRRLILRGLAAGFAGAVLGSVVFDLIGAVVFPLAGTGEPISTTWPSRLLARLTVTLGIAALVIAALGGDSLAGDRPDSEVSPQVPA